MPPQSGLTNLQANGPVDVFYLLPTTSDVDYRATPNVAYDDPDAHAFAVQIAKNQLTAFNGIGRIYAPLYREVPNSLWGAPVPDIQKPLELAYRDTRAAFDYYLAHYNAGRPIVLVSHSQGDIDLFRLLLEEFDGTPLMGQLVAAYIVGQPLDAAFYNDYAQVRACQAPTDLGCVLDWCSFSDGMSDAAVANWAREQDYWIPKTHSWGEPLAPLAPSINPLEWTNDGRTSPSTLDLGSMPSTLSFPAPVAPRLQSLVPGLVTARAGAGATFVTPALLPPGFSLEPRRRHGARQRRPPLLGLPAVLAQHSHQRARSCERILALALARRDACDHKCDHRVGNGRSAVLVSHDQRQPRNVVRGDGIAGRPDDRCGDRRDRRNAGRRWHECRRDHRDERRRRKRFRVVDYDPLSAGDWAGQKHSCFCPAKHSRPRSRKKRGLYGGPEPAGSPTNEKILAVQGFSWSRRADLNR